MKIVDINTYQLDKTFEHVKETIRTTDKFDDITLRSILFSIVDIQQIQIGIIKDLTDLVKIQNKGLIDIVENLKTYNELVRVQQKTIDLLVNRK